MALYADGERRIRKSINPIWKDDPEGFGEANAIVVHARSAFEDRDIRIENNMPFFDDRLVFVFNGELRGVRIKSEGRIGAEKIFNFAKRFDKGDFLPALRKATAVIAKRTAALKAMNILVFDGERAFVSSTFAEREEYFTMRVKRSDDALRICSAPYSGEDDWQRIPNNSAEAYQ